MRRRPNSSSRRKCRRPPVVGRVGVHLEHELATEHVANCADRLQVPPRLDSASLAGSPPTCPETTASRSSIVPVIPTETPTAMLPGAAEIGPKRRASPSAQHKGPHPWRLDAVAFQVGEEAGTASALSRDEQSWTISALSVAGSVSTRTNKEAQTASTLPPSSGPSPDEESLGTVWCRRSAEGPHERESFRNNLRQ